MFVLQNGIGYLNFSTDKKKHGILQVFHGAYGKILFFEKKSAFEVLLRIIHIYIYYVHTDFMCVYIYK